MSSTSRRLLAAGLGFALQGCARDAPSLPPDLGHLPAEQRLLPGDADSAEGQLDCAGLRQAAAATKREIAAYESTIAANRGHNQAVGYVSAVLLPPLALALRNDDDAKAALNRLQLQSDRIDRLSKARRCGAG